MIGRKTVFVGVILLAGTGLTALFITAILLLTRLRGTSVAAAEAGPEVEILTPVSGARLLARDEQLIEVQAYADRPIQRYELWVDGRRHQRSDLDVTGTVPTDWTTFLWRPTSPGIAILVARAYDDLGRVATSSPRAVEILPWKPEDLLQGSYEVRPGDTLQTIAETFGLLSNDLAQANPGVPLSPPEGQVIQLPVPAGLLPEAYMGDDRQADPEPLDLPWSTSLTIGEAQRERSVEVPPAPAASVPPLSPEALEASASGGCAVVLRWTDRSDTEAGFRLYRYGAVDMDFARVADFAPNEQFDALTFTDQIPLVGNYQYYLAAWNSAGEAASPIRQVVVPPGACPGTGETHLLQLEILDLTTNQPLDRAYCYLSHEFAGREHARLPEDEDAFLSQDDDGWNIEDYAAGPHGTVFAHDLDQPIPVAMECWGWAGAELVNLGSFRNSHPRSDWESLRPVRFTGAGDGFEAVYSIGPFSGELRPLLYEVDCPSQQDRMVAPSGEESNCDTAIPAPYDVRLATDGLPPEASPAEQAEACAQGHTSLEGGTTLGGAAVAALACGWPSRTVVWEWDGDRSQIEAFHVSFEYSAPARAFYGGLGTLRRYEVTLGSMAQLFPIPGRVSCDEALTVRVYAFGYEHYPPDTPHYSEGGAIPDPPDDYFIRTSPNSRPYRIYGPPCPHQAQAQLVLGNLHVDHSRDVDGLEVLCFFCEEDHTQEAYGVLHLEIESEDGTRQSLAMVNLWDSEDPRSIGNGNHPLDEEEFEICKLVQGIQPLRMRCHQFPAQLSLPGFVMYLEDGDRIVATLVLEDADGATGDDVWCNGITQSQRYTAQGWAQADVSISVDNATEVLRGDEDVSCFLGMHIEGLGLTGGVTPAP